MLVAHLVKLDNFGAVTACKYENRVGQPQLARGRREGPRAAPGALTNQEADVGVEGAHLGQGGDQEVDPFTVYQPADAHDRDCVRRGREVSLGSVAGEWQIRRGLTY